MSGNSFGFFFKLTTFGESHGSSIGGVIDGVPAGIKIDEKKIQDELNRRKPGQSNITTKRKEDDLVEILSGVFNGTTIGTPIGFVIKNKDKVSKDYDHLKDNFRPSHADFTYQEKFGIRDHRGGGRSSARETACRIVAGAVAKQAMKKVFINAYVSSVGDLTLDKNYKELDLSNIESNKVRCPDNIMAKKMENLIENVKNKGDTIGGIITCVIKNAPIGLGQPVYDRLNSHLARAMLSINAVKGFDYGSGFEGTKMLGSQHNDQFNENFSTKTNHSGGIQGGISNGEDIYFRVAFKPVATVMKPIKTIDKEGHLKELRAKGRHDPCVLPRAVPIVEAMAAMVIFDFMLIDRTSRL